MKKYYLVSFAFLLALTGCKGGEKKGSIEPSALTPEEAFAWAKDGNYTVDITGSYYIEGDDEADVIKVRFKKDDMKVEVLEGEETEDDWEFVTDCIYDFTDPLNTHYYGIAGRPIDVDYEGNIWYQDDDFGGEQIDYFSELLFEDEQSYNFFTACLNASWELDGFTYRVESKIEDNVTARFTVVVNTSYIESMKMEFIEKDNSDSPFHSEYEYIFSHIGETIVDIPITINDVYDTIDGMMEKLTSSRSYTITYTVTGNYPGVPNDTVSVDVVIFGDEFHLRKASAEGDIYGRYVPATDEQEAIYYEYCPVDGGYSRVTLDYSEFSTVFRGFISPKNLGTYNLKESNPIDEAYCLLEVPTLTNERVMLKESAPNGFTSLVYEMDENGLPTRIVGRMESTVDDVTSYVNYDIALTNIGGFDFTLPVPIQ